MDQITWYRTEQLEKKPASKLSEREREVVACASEGLTDKEIARRLNISIGTINTYWARIRQKVGIASRTEIVVASLREELDGMDLGNHRRGQLGSLSVDILEQFPQAMVVIRPDGTILEFNQAAAKLMRREVKNILGQNVEVLMPECARSVHNAAMQQVDILHGAPVRTWRVMAMRGDGSLIPIQLTVSRARHGDSTVFVGVLERIEVEVPQSPGLPTQLHDLFNGMSDALLFLDEDCRIVAVNPYAESFLGFPERDLMGVQLDSLIAAPHYDDEVSFKCCDMVKSQPAGSPAVVLRCRTKEGGSKRVLSVFTVSRTPEFRAIAFLRPLRDPNLNYKN